MAIQIFLSLPLLLFLLLSGCDESEDVVLEEESTTSESEVSTNEPSTSQDEGIVEPSVRNALDAIQARDLQGFLKLVEKLPEEDQVKVRDTLRGEAVGAYWQTHRPPNFTEADVYKLTVLETLPKPSDANLFDVWAAAHMTHFP
jgi:hypothetical protein